VGAEDGSWLTRYWEAKQGDAGVGEGHHPLRGMVLWSRRIVCA